MVSRLGRTCLVSMSHWRLEDIRHSYIFGCSFLNGCDRVRVFVVLCWLGKAGTATVATEPNTFRRTCSVALGPTSLRAALLGAGMGGILVGSWAFDDLVQCGSSCPQMSGRDDFGHRRVGNWCDSIGWWWIRLGQVWSWHDVDSNPIFWWCLGWDWTCWETLVEEYHSTTFTHERVMYWRMLSKSIIWDLPGFGVGGAEVLRVHPHVCSLRIQAPWAPIDLQKVSQAWVISGAPSQGRTIGFGCCAIPHWVPVRMVPTGGSRGRIGRCCWGCELPPQPHKKQSLNASWK